MEQTDKKKTALRGYQEAKEELSYWCKRVEELEKLNTYHSPTASKAPAYSGPGDPTGAAVIALEAARENKEEAKNEARVAMEQVMSIIRTAPKATHRILLMRQYIDGLTLEEIAEAEYRSTTWVTTNLKKAIESITLLKE